MKAFTFKHGIHPPDYKSATDSHHIEVVLPKPGEILIYPMQQHIGAPCEPIVTVGERVRVGQKIADSAAAVSSPIHASISGVVKGFDTTLTPTGITANAILIENDALMEEIPMRGTESYLQFTKEEYLAKIREAGIVGLGGAGFPTHVKLNPPPDKKIEYIIVNASECEPYLTTDHRVMIEQPNEIRRGLQILLKMFPEAKGCIGIETNKIDAIQTMTAVCRGDDRITVVPLKTKYPQGSEKQMILACTGRQVPSGGLPADVGCIVNNVDTVIAIDRCVKRGRPLMRKVVTIVGGAVKNPGNYKARLGMTYASLIEATGGFKTEPAKLVSGGPLMGVSMFDLYVPVIKTSSAVLCFTKEESQMPDESVCIRCGKCVEHCPVSLMPFELNRYILHGQIDLFKKFHGMDCIECGSCSYVCPAKRHISQSIRATRRYLLSQRKK